MADPAPARRFSLEDIVGGRLPIWIGGAALVLAGFFLVRYSIESGLLGPVVRTLLAAVFSALLVGVSEIARRLPAMAGDPRVGQVLAGAGVASAYGTLYIAATQYGLINAPTAFMLMVAVTALALGLALRHGPPTAVMALAGGFAAPLIAGFESAGVGPLLVYLAVFVAALFGLAIRRGWGWLALGALAAAFGWANLLLIWLDARDAAAIATFVVALAVGGTLALPAAGIRLQALRIAPLVAGLLQLVLLAPVLDFSGLAWSFNLTLAAAALLLAWRDDRLRLGALAAAVLTVLLLAAGFAAIDSGATPVAAVAATLLFAGAGGALSRTAREWAGVAVAGLIGPVLAGHALQPSLLSAPAWSVLELALATAAAALAWRHRDRAGAGDIGLIMGTFAAGLLAAVALATVLPVGWTSLPVAAAMVLTALWARRVADDQLAALPVLALGVVVALALPTLAGVAEVLARSLTGETIHYDNLPPLNAALLRLAAPAALATGLLLFDRASFGRARGTAGVTVFALATVAAYTLAKQPLAIATDAQFLASGFLERAGITLLFLAAGVGLWRAGLVRAGTALASIALARLAAFDLLALNPAIVPQQVGSLPLLNAAVLLPAFAAVLLIRRPGNWRLAHLALTALAIAAFVRQLAHGSLLTGPVGSTENWGYSAGFLGLAIAWLYRGIITGSRTLRAFGLGLLTIVTLKVFLIDVASSGGLLRIVALLGLGFALIGIGWGYRRVFPGGSPQPSP